MFGRIGDFAQSELINTQLLQAQTRSRITQAQISSGKIADRYSELAPQTEQLINVKQVLGQNVQFQENISQTIGKLDVMESAISSIFDIATRTRTLALQRINDPDSTPGIMSSEFQSMLDQTASLLNEDINGRYLFGGSQTARAPVELDPTFAAFGSADDSYYQGDDLVLSVRVDIDVDITTTMSADLEGFRELIGGLRGLMNGDILDDDEVLDNSLALVNESLGKIADYQSELGIRQAQMDRINESHLDTELYLENRVSEIEDIDITEAITRLSQDQIVLESAMATIARLNQISLVDYI